MASVSTNTQDEFDDIPDPFEDDDVDWTNLLSAPNQSIPQPSSPEYFPNDPLDDAFLAQLDMLDGTNPVTATAPHNNTVPQLTVPDLLPLSASTAVPNPPRMRTKRPRTASEEGILTPSRKSSSYSPPQSGSQRKRRKGVDTILAGFEEDLMCPICCDIFVATHLLNPCGHSFCGDCGWQWAVKNQKTACPVCRTRLTSTPMIPNVSMDKMVDQMLLSRSYHGDTDWKIGGQKLVEFQRRQKNWKDGAAERNRIPSNVVKPTIWMVLDEEEEDEDGDYYEDDD